MKNFDVCNETQKELTYTLDGVINQRDGGGGVISGIISLLANQTVSLLANGWAYIRGTQDRGGL